MKLKILNSNEKKGSEKTLSEICSLDNIYSILAEKNLAPRTDLKFLKNLNDYRSGRILDGDDAKSLAYPNKRGIVKKILKQAIYYRDHKEWTNYINGKYCNNQEIAKMAKDLLKQEGSELFTNYQTNFLVKTASSDYEIFSAKQAAYLESINNFFNDVISPHVRKEAFNIGAYSKNTEEKDDVYRLIKFAIHGKMIGATPKDFAEQIREKYYDDSKGLNSLREKLVDKYRCPQIVEKRFGKIITDLEGFYEKTV
ncbi:hypothetical protein GF378_00115 [Candidatus Pacearchaeota archaeon]|nr:hypothetical protein [Candidatus Pacearchaeota archaeon]